MMGSEERVLGGGWGKEEGGGGAARAEVDNLRGDLGSAA